jgi:hypothetical protein
VPIVSIPLTQGKTAIIDAADADLVASYKWRAVRNKKQWYACTSVRRKIVYMHRLILGTPKGALTDHKNGDGLDNRRVNLRSATHGDNARNRRGDSSQSGYRGVSWNAPCGKWEVSLSVDDKTLHFGLFSDAKEAALVRDEAARRFHGKFAVLNFPVDDERGVS